MRLEIACSDDAARTGRRGDGKVFVTPVTEAIDIRTQQTGQNIL
ncbi:P-II family nitrogen regulator [Salinibacter altiplanensis]|nr:P-II family nitrogen regulator [Salinibacter altiplanensis]